MKLSVLQMVPMNTRPSLLQYTLHGLPDISQNHTASQITYLSLGAKQHLPRLA